LRRVIKKIIRLKQEGSAAGLLLAARALPLRRAASGMPSKPKPTAV
jgi:hypothetical protein